MNASAAICALLLSSMQPALAERPPLMAWATPLSSPATSRTARCSDNIRRTTTTTAASSLSGRRFAPRTRQLPTAAARRRRPATALSLSDQKEAEAAGKSLFIFGVGYVATAVALTFLRKGWTVHGTCTDPRKVKSLREQGIETYIFDDWSGPMMKPEPLEALASATCILSTVPPALQSGTDPVLAAHMPELQWAHRNGSLRWLGYLSSTGVYGDRGGGWVTEEDEPWPAAPRTKARLKAERSWLRLHEKDGIPTHVLRLAGIYGPGRSALDSVARHNGDIRLAGSDDGTMVSRIHVADIVSVVESSIERPEPGMIMNVADDLPSTRYETLAFGCKLLGYPRQDPDPSEKYVNRRGGGNKRVDNGKMRSLLAASGRPLLFPDYRVGLRALQEGDSRPLAPSADPARAVVGDDALPTTPTTPGIPPFATPSTPSSPSSPSTPSTPCTPCSREYNSEGGGAARVEAELKALSRQVSRLEASLDKVLVAVAEKGAVVGDGGKGVSAGWVGPGNFARDGDEGGAEGAGFDGSGGAAAGQDGEEEVLSLQDGSGQLDDSSSSSSSSVDVGSSSSGSRSSVGAGDGALVVD